MDPTSVSRILLLSYAVFPTSVFVILALVIALLAYLKVPGPIGSDFFQSFRDLGIRRKFIFFSLPLVNFTVEKCTVWKI